MIDDAAIRGALSGVHDPCSVAAGRPLSLVDMGLLRSWCLEDGTLFVTFAVTFAGCTMAPHFLRAAEAELARLSGVAQVRASVDTDFTWTPDLMPAPPPMRGTPQAWRNGRPSASFSVIPAQAGTHEH